MMPSAIPMDALIPSAVNRRLRLAAVSVQSRIVPLRSSSSKAKRWIASTSVAGAGKSLSLGIRGESHVRGREVRGQEHGKGQQAQHDGLHAIGVTIDEPRHDDASELAVESHLGEARIEAHLDVLGVSQELALREIGCPPRPRTALLARECRDRRRSGGPDPCSLSTASPVMKA